MDTPVGIKQGAQVGRLRWQIIAAAGCVWYIFRQHAQRLVITSGDEGHHMVTSLHYKEEAIDIRTRNLDPDTRNAIFVEIKDALDDMGFDVVLEGDHFHLEFDPHEGDHSLTETVS